MYNIKDVVVTRKQHPCGGSEWEIIRTGADYKLKCLKCGHVVMIDAQQLPKMIKKHIPHEQNEQKNN